MSYEQYAYQDLANRLQLDATFMFYLLAPKAIRP